MIDDVDDRLLVFLPFAKRELVRSKPWLSELSDADLRDAFLKALEASGNARRVKMPNGRFRLEATDEYLRYIETNH